MSESSTSAGRLSPQVHRSGRWRGSARIRDSTPRRGRRRSSASRNSSGGNVLKRSVSDPILLRAGSHSEDESVFVAEGDAGKKKKKEKKKEKALMRPQTLSDIFDASPCTSPWLPPRTPLSSSFYKSEKKFAEDSLILVNVTVEGSTGPIKAIVKMGTTVDDVIKVIIDKYAQEGRHPVLDTDTNMFELHLSNFSMESLNRTDKVGGLGSRTFVLRQQNYAVREQSMLFAPTPGPLFTSFIVRRIKKIGRRTRKFWKIIDCMVCG